MNKELKELQRKAELARKALEALVKAVHNGNTAELDHAMFMAEKTIKEGEQ